MVNRRTIFFQKLILVGRSLSRTMENNGLFKQGWKWFQSQKNAYSRAHNAVCCCRDRVGVFIGRHWPMVCGGCAWLCRLLRFLLLQWRECIRRGFRSLIQLGSASLLLIMWSCFLSLTSISCLADVLLSMVLSDSVKKKDYDEQLRKEGSKTISVCHKYETSQKHNPDYFSEESRRIQCTECGHSHIWVCTSRSKTKARWCQDCCQHHHAKDGDGWVEYKGSLVFERPQKMEIPRAFVCAEGKIFDVSEWAICQGMACRPNTHRPSFHVNMVGLGIRTPRSMSSRFPWELDAEMMDEDEEEFELWLQQALASSLFRETSKWRPGWSPFKLNKKLGKQWRRTSC